MSRNLYSIEFQEQALIKVRDRGTRSVLDVAADLHMSVGTLRKWIGKSNQAKADASDPAATLPDDLPAQSWGGFTLLEKRAVYSTHKSSSSRQLLSCVLGRQVHKPLLKSWP
ncbi:MAG: hypothetical protein ABI410_05720 [Rhodoferax sp.]|uniref:hypothetical protein n=1 Tax=Rhodoferax sp. TaxID=50421 RepID=UPI0032639A1F